MKHKFNFISVWTADEIKKKMTSCNINQKEMAGCLGVSEQFMSRVLTGKVAGSHLRLKITLFLQSLMSKKNG